MDPLAALFVQRDVELRSILNIWRQRSGDVELAPLGGVGTSGNEAVMIGEVGNFRFWVYQALYSEDGVTELKVIPDNTVILANAAQAEGVRTYGAILDTKALRPMRRFPKYWETDDPSVGLTMTQSAPLPVLGRPNAVLAATVA
jgi:hypothetical protein